MSKRDISPFLQTLRNFLLGRQHKTALRFQQDIAPRTTDPPNLPDGPHVLLSANYYFTRDARRDVKPAESIFDFSSKKLLASGKGPEAAGTQLESKEPNTKQITSGKTPGKVYAWDS